MRRSEALLTWAAAALAVLLIASPAQAADILIGFHGPLTGPASWIGLGGRDGALMAVNEINASGGIGGRNIRLIPYDDANKPSEAEAVTKKMVDGDGVFAILGAGPSNTAVVAAETAMRDRVPYVNSSGATPKIMDLRSRWVFSASTVDARDIAENEAAFVSGYLKPKTVAFINAADETATPLIDAVSGLLTDRYGIKVVSRETFNRGDTEFSSQLLATRRAQPDLIMLSGGYVEEARIVRQARELGIRTPIKADTSSMNNGVLTIAGSAAEGLYVSYVAPYINGDTAADMMEFERRFKAAYPGSPADRPNYVDMFGYGSMYALAEGLKRAGPDLTRENFVKAMETLDDFKATDGFPKAVNVINPLTFTKTHNGNRRTSHFVVKGGKFTRVTDFSPPIPSTAFPADDTLQW